VLASSAGTSFLVHFLMRPETAAQAILGLRFWIRPRSVRTDLVRGRTGVELESLIFLTISARHSSEASAGHAAGKTSIGPPAASVTCTIDRNCFLGAGVVRAMDFARIGAITIVRPGQVKSADRPWAH
jgi:hypothetical protein